MLPSKAGRAPPAQGALPLHLLLLLLAFVVRRRNADGSRLRCATRAAPPPLRQLRKRARGPTRRRWAGERPAAAASRCAPAGGRDPMRAPGCRRSSESSAPCSRTRSLPRPRCRRAGAHSLLAPQPRKPPPAPKWLRRGGGGAAAARAAAAAAAPPPPAPRRRRLPARLIPRAAQGIRLLPH
uniref:serine/arginine-rich splicing factor SR45-like n=1 Tax=Podarcis muralis TaxID=64176 RepID=UPI0010A0488D|nr:serine/arginine-rich splicing factor SR45-like [Podarcis muralis]